MIDTPGFNDTTRSDAEVLQTLATYLGASYANGVRIHGVIILHSISENRMSGSGKRTIDIIKAICGFPSYRNVTIATTKWPSAPSATEDAILASRESELKSNEEFFGDLVRLGATVVRHNQPTSAQRIVEHLVWQSEIHTPPVLQLQREIVDQNLAIFHTAAGHAVNAELSSARRAHERELREINEQMQSSLSQNNASLREELRQLQSMLAAKLAKCEVDRQALTKTIQDLHEEEKRRWHERLSCLEKQLSEQLRRKEQELSDMEACRNSIREDAARRRRDGCEQPLAASEDKEYEHMVATARKEAKAASRSLRNLRGHTGSILNGGTSGLFSGIASGSVAAGKPLFYIALL